MAYFPWPGFVFEVSGTGDWRGIMAAGCWFHSMGLSKIQLEHYLDFALINISVFPLYSILAGRPIHHQFECVLMN